MRGEQAPPIAAQHCHMGIRPPRRRNALTKGVRRKMIAIIINIAHNQDIGIRRNDPIDGQLNIIGGLV